MTQAKDTHERYWESSSKTERSVKEKGPVSRHLQEILLKLAAQIKFNSVTDAGSGHGTVLRVLQNAYPTVKCLGIDISDTAVGEAKKKYPGIEFIQHDFSSTPAARKSDLVICLDVIEHIDDDSKALKNIAQMTKKYLILSTVKGRMRFGEQEAGHVRNYEFSELTGKVEAAGFKIKKVVKWGFPFYSPIYRNIFELIVRLKGGVKTNTSEPIVNVAEIPFIMILAEPLYWLMKLNIPGMGDHIFLLAELENDRQA